MKSFLERFADPVDVALYWYVVMVLMYQLVDLTFPFAFASSLVPLNLISQALAILGLGFLAFDLAVTKRCLEKRYAAVLWVLVGVMTISSLMLGDFGVIGNGEDPSLVANAKIIVWQMDLMLVIFPYCASMTKGQMLKLVRTVYWATAVVYIPCLLVSFAQYGASVGYDALYGVSTGTRQGFQEGRLFGLFVSVFSAGLVCMTFAIASIYLVMKAEKKFARVAYGVLAMMCFLYAVLSGTRSVFVALVAAAFVSAMVYFMKDGQLARRHYAISAVLRSFAATAVVTCLYFGIGAMASLVPDVNAEKASTPEAMQELESKVIVLYHPEQDVTDDLHPIVASYFDGELLLAYVPGSVAPIDEESLAYFENVEGAEFEQMGELDELLTDLVTRRTDIGDGTELSNGRIAIWSDYLKVVFSDPVTALFGLSPGYYMPVIYDRYADGGDLHIIEYIEKYHPNMIANGKIYDVHNAYVGILIQSGLLGLLLMGVFVYRIAADALRVYWRQKEKNRSLLAWTMAIAFIMLASFFDTELFFHVTAASALFWVLCGFAVNETLHLKRKEM